MQIAGDRRLGIRQVVDAEGKIEAVTHLEGRRGVEIVTAFQHSSLLGDVVGKPKRDMRGARASSVDENQRCRTVSNTGPVPYVSVLSSFHVGDAPPSVLLQARLANCPVQSNSSTLSLGFMLFFR